MKKICAIKIKNSLLSLLYMIEGKYPKSKILKNAIMRWFYCKNSNSDASTIILGFLVFCKPPF